MTSGIEFLLVGKLTYYALAVYILFFLGIFLAIRQKFKQRDGDENGQDQVSRDGQVKNEDIAEEKSARKKMGSSESKAANDEHIVGRVEFKKADSESANDEDAEVQILTKCVLKKPAGDVPYEIVHNFENDQDNCSQNNLRKRNIVKSSEQDSELRSTFDDSDARTKHYVISHTEYTNNVRTTNDLKISCDGCHQDGLTSLERNETTQTPVSELFSELNSEDVATEASSAYQEPQKELDVSLTSYAILSNGELTADCSHFHHLDNEIKNLYQQGRTSAAANLSSVSANNTPFSTDRDSLEKIPGNAIIVPTENLIDLDSNVSHEAKSTQDDHDIASDISVTESEKYQVICLANEVVKQSFQDGFNELNGVSEAGIKRSNVNRVSNENISVGEHAGTLSEQLITEAISDSLECLRSEGIKKEKSTSISRSCDAIWGFSRDLSTEIIELAMAQLQCHQRLTCSKAAKVNVVDESGAPGDSKVNRFGDGLAKTVQMNAFDYLQTQSISPNRTQHSPTAGDNIAAYGNHLAEEILADGYSTLKVGQYARRMSENIALSAYDSASLILNTVKESDHYFSELAERVVYSAYDQMKVGTEASDLVLRTMRNNNYEVSDKYDKPKLTTSHHNNSLHIAGSKSSSMRDEIDCNNEQSDDMYSDDLSEDSNPIGAMLVANGEHSNLSSDENEAEKELIASQKFKEFNESSEDEILDYSRPSKIKRICKGDRPLSGYAEKLAELLAEEDDDLDFLDSDEEFEATLDKIEEKYKSKRQISSEIAKIRKISTADESCTSDDQSMSDVDVDCKNATRSPVAPPLADKSKEFSDQIDEILRGVTTQGQLVCSRAYYKTPAVIDAGCGILKAGMAGQLVPSCTFPSVVGMPKRFSQDLSNIKKSYFVGNEAVDKLSMLHVDYPFKPSVSNWSDIHSVLEYTLETELGINDSEHPVMLTELALKDRRQREKITEIIFERFGVPAFYLASQGPLTLYSLGMVSGICLNSGFGVTQSEPIFEGYSLCHGTMQLNIGGETISNYLGRLLLSARGLAFNSSSEKRILNLIKEKKAYVATDILAEEAKYEKQADMYQVFTLPDGREIELGSELCQATEILFDPSILGINQPSLPELITNSIANVDVSIRDCLAKNVVVSGGNSMLTGFLPRLEKEIDRQREQTIDIKFSGSSEPIIAAWLGGSILASLSAFNSQWITLDEYAERGACIVQAKCF